MFDLPVEIQEFMATEIINLVAWLYLVGCPLVYLSYLWITYSCVRSEGDSWWTLFWAALEGLIPAALWPLIGLWFLTVWVWGRIDVHLQKCGSPTEKKVFGLIGQAFGAVFSLWVIAAIWPFVLAGVLIIALIMLLGEKDGRCEISGAFMYQPMTWREFIRFKITGKGREQATG